MKNEILDRYRNEKILRQMWVFSSKSNIWGISMQNVSKTEKKV